MQKNKIQKRGRKNMKLKTTTTLIFLEEVKRVSQRTNNEYSQIKLADPEIFENYTFYKTDSVNTNDLKPRDKVQATFSITPQGFNNNLNLDSLTKV